MRQAEGPRNGAFSRILLCGVLGKSRREVISIYSVFDKMPDILVLVAAGYLITVTKYMC